MFVDSNNKRLNCRPKFKSALLHLTVRETGVSPDLNSKTYKTWCGWRGKTTLQHQLFESDQFFSPRRVDLVGLWGYQLGNGSRIAVRIIDENPLSVVAYLGKILRMSLPSIATITPELRSFLSIAHKDLPPSLNRAGLAFKPFSTSVFSEIEADWASNPKRKLKHWNWRNWYHHLEYSPNRFEAAVYVDHVLCGVCLGKVIQKHNRIDLHYIEASPSAHALKGQIAPLFFEIAAKFGYLKGLTELRLVHPISDLLAYYTSLGFQNCKPLGEALYFTRKLD